MAYPLNPPIAKFPIPPPIPRFPIVGEDKRPTASFQEWCQLMWSAIAGEGGVQVQTGIILDYAGLIVPLGYLLCDGAPVSRTTYVDLFTVIGTTWGIGDGSTTFNVPDLRDRFTIGAGGAYSPGNTGGSTDITLSTANLPAHNHPVTDPGHSHGVTDPGHVHTALVAASTNTTGSNTDSAVAGNTGSAVTGITINSATTGVTVGNTGSGTPVPILPPFGALVKMIKT